MQTLGASVEGSAFLPIREEKLATLTPGLNPVGKRVLHPNLSPADLGPGVPAAW